MSYLCVPSSESGRFPFLSLQYSLPLLQAAEDGVTNALVALTRITAGRRNLGITSSSACSKFIEKLHVPDYGLVWALKRYCSHNE